MPEEVLQPDDVHVWLTAIDDARPRFAAYAALLDDSERARLDRFKAEHARDEFLTGRALVRTTLSRYVDVPPDQWRFEANEHGCPAISAPKLDRPLRFNLSHTRGLCALAVTGDRDIGVDVEDETRRSSTVKVADRYFSAAEVEALHAVDAAGQTERFFTYWTLKESYIKARRMGLAIPLGKFTFRIETPVRIETDPSMGDDAASWWFEHRRLEGRHHLAVAARGGSITLVVRRVVPEAP